MEKKLEKRSSRKGYRLSWCHHGNGHEALSHLRNVTCLDHNLKARLGKRLEGG